MTKKKSKKKKVKPRNFVLKYMYEFNKPKVEQNKKRKHGKHKQHEILDL